MANKYSITIGQSVMYNGQVCTVVDVGWIIVIIKLPDGQRKTVFKHNVE